MKAVWKICDNYNKMLDGNYESKDKAEEARERVTLGRKGRKEIVDLIVCEAEYVIKYDYIYNLRYDLNKLEHFKKENNTNKVQEYLEIIASNVKRMLELEE